MTLWEFDKYFCYAMNSDMTSSFKSEDYSTPHYQQNDMIWSCTFLHKWLPNFEELQCTLALTCGTKWHVLSDQEYSIAWSKAFVKDRLSIIEIYWKDEVPRSQVVSTSKFLPSPVLEKLVGWWEFVVSDIFVILVYGHPSKDKLHIVH